MNSALSSAEVVTHWNKVQGSKATKDYAFEVEKDEANR